MRPDQSFTASTPDNAVFVRVAVSGHTLGIQIEPEAMRLRAREIADRIMACNDVAYLKGQLLIRAELQRAAIPVDDMPKNLQQPYPTFWAGPGWHVIYYPMRDWSVFNLGCTVVTNQTPPWFKSFIQA